jgi:hypothetical protein
MFWDMLQFQAWPRSKQHMDLKSDNTNIIPAGR